MIKLINILKEIILEVTSTDHFGLRLNERGNILDIINLDKIPLKEYKKTDVKEKLKENISNEIKKRADILMTKSISSDAFDVGLKLLKPVLIVDKQKYPLILFSKYTKDIKDKEGNVKGNVLVDNIGFLYFAIISDNKAITLLLLDKEDDYELSDQIKQHVERKTGNKKDVKILTPTHYVYEIDLDKLMGNEKEETNNNLIDPNTLPYKVRTDYRAGAKFEHEKFGVGTIVTTSNGTGGKGDSMGRLEWVDVKYSKPYLKSGKFTDIRRFEKILTLVSPYLINK